MRLREAIKLSLSATGDKFCEQHLPLGWVTPMLPMIFSPISSVGCLSRLWPRHSLGVARALTN